MRGVWCGWWMYAPDTPSYHHVIARTLLPHDGQGEDMHGGCVDVRGVAVGCGVLDGWG